MAQRELIAAAIELVKQYEGIPDGNPATVAIDPYLDPVGIWTIGWGHAIRYGGRLLRGAAEHAAARALYPEGITREQAEALLRADLLDAGRDVLSLVRVPLDDAQLGALASFTFNLGLANLRASTLLKKLNAGDYAGAAAQFPRWVRAGGEVLPGLVARRGAERTFFLAGNAPGMPARLAPARATRGAAMPARADPKSAYAPVA